MSAPAIPAPAVSAGEADGGLSLRPGEAQALLRVGFERFAKKLSELTKAALDLTDDLFEASSVIPDGDVEAFRKNREEWFARFEAMLRELFEQRLSGKRRKGRRPDSDSSLAALRVLTPFDHEKQAALILASRFLTRFTQREMAALDLRVGLLLDETSTRELDNPFGIPYVLDAVGATSRVVYPSPRVWRPLMERLMVDLTPNINGLYIALNRLLADHGVLPEIKAALRARSELRPSDDRDLLATFTHLMHEAEQPIPGNVVVPETLVDPGVPAALRFDPHGAPPAAAEAPAAPAMDPAAILAGLAALASLAGNAGSDGSAPKDPGDPNDADFPSLEPLMALGTSTSLFATLAQWQKIDLRAAIAKLAPPAGGGEPGAGGVVPLNLLPHIRSAVAAQIDNPVDAIAVDVIALLFDYIFRDPTIAESTRALFSRLQVPVVKAALLDRSFFSDKKHPARQLLDDLAAAAVGAVNDAAYRTAFEQVATKTIDRICADFEIDVAVFRDADRELLEFVNQEHQKSAAALSTDVAKALHAEADEADRAAVRVLLRDRLAGLDVPFEVRAFIETIWADYLAALRKEHGADSSPTNAALATLDDTLWSIVAKERSAQKARLSKMIPSLIGSLRAGCRVMRVPAERSTPFFDTLYQLHMAALKPSATDDQAETVMSPPPVNVHDYVGEMAVGTWLQFDTAKGPVDARLNWVSPMRTKYIFTSRTRSQAFMVTPEELAYQLGSGTARLVVEPVPLWDRAVSAALDSLAARKPPSAPLSSNPAPALA